MYTISFFNSFLVIKYMYVVLKPLLLTAALFYDNVGNMALTTVILTANYLSSKIFCGKRRTRNIFQSAYAFWHVSLEILSSENSVGKCRIGIAPSHRQPPVQVLA